MTTPNNEEWKLPKLSAWSHGLTRRCLVVAMLILNHLPQHSRQGLRMPFTTNYSRTTALPALLS